MAEEFVGMGIAATLVTASIILAAILIGVGRAFSYKRVEYFGVEELVQSIINAAIIGSFAAVIALVATVSSSVVAETCTEGVVIEQLICMLGGTNELIFVLFQEVMKSLNLIGYYQTLSLDFGAFAVSPFINLSSIAGVLSSQLLLLNIVMILVNLNTQIAFFIKDNALSLIFPVGLVLRTLFATRKVGGFMIALAVGLYIFYPAFVVVFPSPQPDINASISSMQQFNNNSHYAAVPVIDLNDNYAIAGKIDVMSGRCQNASNVSRCANVTMGGGSNFTSDLTVVAQSNGNAISKSLLYSVVAPLFSLLITAIFVRELGTLLGSEIGIKTLASV